MLAVARQLSPVLEALVEKGLFDRLPITFSTFFFEQIKDWELLFPAEKNYHERLFTHIDALDGAARDRIFGPLRVVEQRMGVDAQNWPRRQFTLEQVDFLNRSPHYPEWRRTISSIFAEIDPVLDADVARKGHARLVVVLSPPELPVGPDRLWLRTARYGKRIRIDMPERTDEYLPLLLSGKRAAERAPTLASLYKGEPYSSWIVEAGDSLSELEPGPAVVKLSYTRLKSYRTRLMGEVSRLVEKEQIRGPRQLSARLKTLRVVASESEFAADSVLSEFARAVLLSGNGTLLINNTFVEWATMQAVRRAKPSVTLISFGVRNKVKPFSSLLIYSDQEKSNLIPTQMDTLGSYVDLEVFYQYIWQEFEKYAEYRRNTAYLFVCEGMDEMLAIAPPDFPLMAESQPVRLESVHASARSWLGL